MVLPYFWPQSYLLGDVETCLRDVADDKFHLLLLSRLMGDTVLAAADGLKSKLAVASRHMKADHQVYVITRFPETQSLKAVAEESGYDVGTLIHWTDGTDTLPMDSYLQLGVQSILHLRRGKAKMVHAIVNALGCSHDSLVDSVDRRPLKLIRELILAATNPGDSVLDIGAGAATANIACLQS